MARQVLLVVDDDPGVVEIVAATVAGIVDDVVSVTSAEEAMKVFVERRPAAVVLDIGLPDRDGFELLQEMRETSDVPVLVLSGRVAPADQKHGLDLGADLYVTKPFSPAVLRARVAALLRRAGSDG